MLGSTVEMLYIGYNLPISGYLDIVKVEKEVDAFIRIFNFT